MILNPPCTHPDGHYWATIRGQDRCIDCGAIRFDGQSFADVFVMYGLYLRGLVEDTETLTDAPLS